MAGKHIPRHVLDVVDPAVQEKLGVEIYWADSREEHPQSYAMMEAHGYSLVDEAMAEKLGIKSRVNAEGAVKVGVSVLMYMDRKAFTSRQKMKDEYALTLRERQAEEFAEKEEQLVAESKGR